MNDSTQLISQDVEETIKEIKDQFSYGINSDFTCHSLQLQRERCAYLCYYSSIVDRSMIQEQILSPLLQWQEGDIDLRLPFDKTEKITRLQDAIVSIQAGKAILFLAHSSVAYTMDVAQFQHRGIEKPTNENVVKGPKEAFTESLGTNLSLIRKRTLQHQLIAESITVGERFPNDVTMMYIKDLANEQLVNLIRTRLKEIKVDTVRNVELLEQHLEERPYSLIPTILYTERPDRASTFLEDGYITLLMENSSSCLILPVTFWAFFHSPEDRYLRFSFGNFSRFIRMIAIFITLFTSAIYIAITNFHSEMVPMDLLLAIASARERVPFPAVLEVFIMEFAFELIREAGLRIPSPLGPTIGIVGAIIIGQAAVQANVISPIIIIVVSLSGLSSFTISDISFNYTVRLTRFIFIFAASFYGIYSLTGAFLLWVMYLFSLRSFGVPFLSPASPYSLSSNDTFFRPILKKEKYRPNYLLPKDIRKQED
ncbi:spore germination protein [Bacillus weihaiensis]|uniref:Spore gernimation protein KA n=1 Tax=Bacillus weihaiensis TaxID=1547283 RepID=A0A1L3MUU8_9BACI|nr:spore germination protein [Bacillus weihaiensis]APH06121.1 spore gernimation protein KA [Bacillus weihaiensis]